MPDGNDSPFLLDKHKRGVSNLHRMARYPTSAPVDLVIVGAGAGGLTLAQRLARKGWRIVVLEKGPFWDPDRDWVSDEKGAGSLYWTDNRLIGGTDPIKLGKNNSGVGVGGSMTHFAGYTPRFHPSDFETKKRDGVGADWPISYWDLKPAFERLERELPVAGQDWPWGTRTRIRTTRIPCAVRRSRRGRERATAASRCVSARSRSPTGRSATGRTASTVASACRAAR